MSNSSIWLPIDRTLSGVTTPGQSGPGSDGNEGVFHIPQSSSITGASPSDCLVLYPGHSFFFGGGAEYSTAPDDWANYYETDDSLQLRKLNQNVFNYSYFKIQFSNI